MSGLTNNISEYKHLWYLKNKVKLRARNKAMNKCPHCKAQLDSPTHREFHLQYQDKHRKSVTLWRYKNLEKARIMSRAARKRGNARLKKKLFDYLGDKCARCGFSDVRALQVDHVNGFQGKRDSRSRSGTHLYRQIITGKLPKEDFQILCANCNWIKKVENREIPGYQRKL